MHERKCFELLKTCKFLIDIINKFSEIIPTEIYDNLSWINRFKKWRTIY